MEARTRNPLEVRPRGTISNVLVGVTYVALYLLAALTGREVAIVSGGVPGVAPWFPAAGFTIALLVGFGLRWAPLAFVAELLSGLLIFHVGVSAALADAAGLLLINAVVGYRLSSSTASWTAAK